MLVGLKMQGTQQVQSQWPGPVTAACSAPRAHLPGLTMDGGSVVWGGRDGPWSWRGQVVWSGVWDAQRRLFPQDEARGTAQQDTGACKAPSESERCGLFTQAGSVLGRLLEPASCAAAISRGDGFLLGWSSPSSLLGGKSKCTQWGHSRLGSSVCQRTQGAVCSSGLQDGREESQTSG